MSALGVFVFQFDETDLYALTLYRSGDNVPVGPAPGHWIFRGRLLMTRQSLATLPLDADEAIARLMHDGYYLTRFGSTILFFSD